MEKHILIVSTTSDFLRKFEMEDVKLLLHMGYVVHYAANLNEPDYLSEEASIKALGVRVHHISAARSPFLWKENRLAYHQLLWLIRRYHICALHCHTPVGGVLGRLAGRAMGPKKLLVLYTAHGFHFYKGAPLWNRVVYYWVERMLARSTDMLIVINREDATAAKKFHLRRGGRLYQIPGVGVDTETFRPIPPTDRQRLRRQLGIQENCFFLVSVGELNENKNHKVVLEALLHSKQQGVQTDKLRYAICGDGFFREKLHRWVEEHGLTDQVILLGYRGDIPAVLGCADASVFPSKREGLGMAALESLAMGVPVLAGDNRGTREYMVDGYNGFVCPPTDMAAFEAGIQRLLTQTPAQRARMKQCCIQSVRRFQKEEVRLRMRQIYQDMTERLTAQC